MLSVCLGLAGYDMVYVAGFRGFIFLCLRASLPDIVGRLWCSVAAACA